MQRLAWLALVTAAVLTAPTLLLATNRRRTIVQLGLATALVALLLVPISRALSETVVGAAPSPQGEQVVAVVADTMLESMSPPAGLRGSSPVATKIVHLG